MDRIAGAGATIADIALPGQLELRSALDEIGRLLSGEAWASWGEHATAAPDLVYAPVRLRLEEGRTLSAADMARVRSRAGELATIMQAQMAPFDALVYPTVCCAPPPIADLIEDGPAFAQANKRASRNTRFANFFGLCALTLPCGRDDLGLPVGLQFTALPFTENKLLRIAKAAEDRLSAEA